MPPEFFRQATNDEKQDFKPLVAQKHSVQRIFRTRLEAAEKKSHKEFKPFCAKCAKLDFTDLMEKKVREYERMKGHASAQWDKIKVDIDDLSVYSKPDRFEFVKDTDAMEPLGIADFSKGHLQRQIKTGIHRDYRCKVRGCGISINITLEDLKKQLPIEKVKKAESVK